MTNQETNVTNSFETTLSSSLASGATTINVASTTGAPSVPFYAVIDPGSDAKREVVLVDSGKTATTLTLTAASKRGLDGTSDVAHDSGATVAVVPVAALWTDINDRVEGHTHSGASDGTAIATGDLTGHDKAAHDALNIDAATVASNTPANLRDRATHTGTQAISTLSDHNKANHDSLGLDHGSLSGLGDFEDDHGTGHDTSHAKVQVTRTTNTALTGTPAKVNFETEVSDPGSNFDISTDTYTAPEDGAYAVAAYAKKASGSDSVSIYAYVNGSSMGIIVNVGTGATAEAHGGGVFYLRTTDALTIQWSNGGGSATMDEIEVEIVRL